MGAACVDRCGQRDGMRLTEPTASSLDPGSDSYDGFGMARWLESEDHGENGERARARAMEGVRA